MIVLHLSWHGGKKKRYRVRRLETVHTCMDNPRMWMRMGFGNPRHAVLYTTEENNNNNNGKRHVLREYVKPNVLSGGGKRNKGREDDGEGGDKVTIRDMSGENVPFVIEHREVKIEKGETMFFSVIDEDTAIVSRPHLGDRIIISDDGPHTTPLRLLFMPCLGGDQCNAIHDIINKKHIPKNILKKYHGVENDIEVALAAVYISPLTLQNVSEELRNDKEVVMMAVQQDGRVLKYASENLRAD